MKNSEPAKVHAAEDSGGRPKFPLHTRILRQLEIFRFQFHEFFTPPLPGQSRARYLQTVWDMETGRYSQIVKRCGRVIRTFPFDPVAYNNRACALHQLKQYDLAIADYSQAIELGLKTADCYANRDAAWAAKKNWIQANDDLVAAAELNPSDKDIYILRGYVRFSAKDYEGAIADSRKAISLQPISPDPERLNLLAWILSTCPDDRLRDGPEAIRLATNACDLTTFKAGYIVGTLAAANAEVGNFEEAIRLQEDAISLGTPAELGALKIILESYRTGQPWRDPHVSGSD